MACLRFRGRKSAVAAPSKPTHCPVAFPATVAADYPTHIARIGTLTRCFCDQATLEKEFFQCEAAPKWDPPAKQH